MRRRCAVIVFLLCLILAAPTLFSAPGLETDQEQEVIEVLNRFRQGIDEGDRSLGARLAAAGFAEVFVGFYDLLLDTYSRANMAFPMIIGKLKILADGRAKVEVYINPARNLFIFTLVRSEGEWKINHLEGIRFPVYDIPALPYSRPYSIPETQRGFMMAERDMASKSRVYERLLADCGRQEAQNFFLDGPGFRVAMDAWLPFVEGAAQFVIFLAIIESNYYGSRGTVVSASFEEGEVRFAPLRDFEVLEVASFWPKISRQDYEELLTLIIKDRAEKCGLEAEISFEGTGCVIRVRRTSSLRRP